jgi:hypothetical protein
LECDPVARILQAALTDMNAGEIRAVISIKIGDRKMARRLRRATRRGTHSPRKRKQHGECYKGPQAYPPNNAIEISRSHIIRIRKPRSSDSPHALDQLHATL